MVGWGPPIVRISETFENSFPTILAPFAINANRWIEWTTKIEHFALMRTISGNSIKCTNGNIKMFTIWNEIMHASKRNFWEKKIMSHCFIWYATDFNTAIIFDVWLNCLWMYVAHIDMLETFWKNKISMKSFLNLKMLLRRICTKASKIL